MRDLELGVSTLLWYDCDDLIPHLPLLRATAIRHIELRRLSPHLDCTCASSIQRLGGALRDNGLTVHSVHMPDKVIADMSSLDDAARRSAVAEAKAVAVVSTKLGVKLLVTHAGGALEDEPERDHRFAAGQESVAELAAFCRDLGLLVAVENSLPTKPRVGDTVAEVVRFVEGIGLDSLGFCLDTSHANIGEDPVAALALVGPKLMTLHISDNDSRSDLHALPFDGTVDWPAFVRALNAQRYHGVFMLEVRATQNSSDMLAQAQARFERLMTF